MPVSKKAHELNSLLLDMHGQKRIASVLPGLTCHDVACECVNGLQAGRHPCDGASSSGLEAQVPATPQHAQAQTLSARPGNNTGLQHVHTSPTSAVILLTVLPQHIGI
jgi:hypothetical protein